jgi:D-3-phosphoglycerate dehydrogenase
MKIASIVTQMDYSDSNVGKLKQIGEFIQHSVKKIDEDELIELVRDVDYLILGSSGIKFFSKKVFSVAKKLKVISMLGAGVDVVDLDAAKESNVLITNARGANSQSVAEHIFGVALSLSKRIVESHEKLREKGVNFEGFEGIELYGKTLGIIGFGEIGSRVAKIASGFDMEVLYYQRTRLDINEYKYVGLEDLFSRADIIVVAVPGNESTNGLINQELLSKMKNKSILVSISRESVVDEEYILEMLDSKKIFGFGFDADINESPNPLFYKYPNVVITPHTAFFTQESEAKVENTAVENIIKFHEGNPQNIVSKK